MGITKNYLGRAISGILMVSLGGYAAGTHAQEQSRALDNVSIWLGGYYASSDTNLDAHSKDGIARGNLNLEDDLDFQKRKVAPRARLDFVFGEHQGFTFDYYNIDRDHSRTISSSVNYLGHQYDASASLEGSLRFNFGSAAYRWWFGTGDDVFGVGVGAAYYKIHGGVTGSATLNGVTTASTHTGADADAWAPNLQLGWRHAFNDQWRMYINASGVRKNGGNLNGHIYDAALGVEWFPWKNVGFGAEYAYTKIRLNEEKRAYDLDLDMKLNGPSAYVRFRF
jgi:hypothetical protein